MIVHLELRSGIVGKVSCRKERRGRSYALVSSFDLNGSLCEFEEPFDITKAGSGGMPPSSISDGDQIAAVGSAKSSRVFLAIAINFAKTNRIIADDGLPMILGGIGFFTLFSIYIYSTFYFSHKSVDLFVNLMWSVFCSSAGIVFLYKGFVLRIARRMIERPIN